MFLKIFLLFWMTAITVFLAIFALYCFYILIKYYNYWKKRGVSTEPNFLLVNDIYKVFSGKLHVGQFYRNLHKKYPKEKYFGFYILGKPHLFLRDPKLIKTIMTNDFNYFEHRSFTCDEEVDPIVAKCPFLSRNPEWKETRVRLNALFSPAKMRIMSPLISETCVKMQNFLEKRDSQIVDVKEIAENFVTTLLPLFFLGIDSKSDFEKANKIMKLCMKNVCGKGIHQAFVYFCYLFVPKFVQWFNIRLCNFDCLKEMIVEMVTFRKNNEILMGKDIADLLIETKENLSDKNGDMFDENWLISQLLTFIVAGFIPTSSLFSFMLYELASNPKYQEQLRKEIYENFPLDDEPITYEKLGQMKFLSMISFETLRRHPFGGFMNRTCTQRYVIEETGLEIEEGTPIWMSVDALNVDPIYYPNPDVFDPERFRGGIKAMENAGIFIPFLGPRRCLGEKFAHAASKIAVVHVIKKFRVELCDQTEKRITFDKKLISISAANGIKLRVHKLK